MQHPARIRHAVPPPGSVASVFQGVAAKIGSGIIDDPLEAFNRIMREKERRKVERRDEERRGSPIVRRRSRSRPSISYSRYVYDIQSPMYMILIICFFFFAFADHDLGPYDDTPDLLYQCESVHDRHYCVVTRGRHNLAAILDPHYLFGSDHVHHCPDDREVARHRSA